MPRGRPRKVAAPAAQPQTPAPAAQPQTPAPAVEVESALPRPIQIDTAQLEIPDIPLFMRLQAAEGRSEAEVQQLVFEMVPMLERLVVGGLAGFKLHDLPAVIKAVFEQLGEASNPGN